MISFLFRLAVDRQISLSVHSSSESLSRYTRLFYSAFTHILRVNLGDGPIKSDARGDRCNSTCIRHCCSLRRDWLLLCLESFEAPPGITEQPILSLIFTSASAALFQQQLAIRFHISWSYETQFQPACLLTELPRRLLPANRPRGHAWEPLSKSIEWVVESSLSQSGSNEANWMDNARRPCRLASQRANNFHSVQISILLGRHPIDWIQTNNW